jgi:hypothetical protein
LPACFIVGERIFSKFLGTKLFFKLNKINKVKQKIKIPVIRILIEGLL